MTCNNNYLSPGCLSQRIMFRLGPLWVVHIKVKCGAAGEQQNRRQGGKGKVDTAKRVNW